MRMHHRWLSAIGMAVLGLVLSLSVTNGQQDTPDTAAAPQTLPAVDGVNAKIEIGGGGWFGDRSHGFYGGGGSLAIPLAHQWGAQLDAGIGSDGDLLNVSGAGHLFWRDPSIGLIGAYGSYAHMGGLDSGNMGATHIAAEGQLYWRRWNFTVAAGAELVSYGDLPSWWNQSSMVARFFDSVTAAYYVTDNLQLWAGQRYAYGMNGAALGVENAVALGGGRMASLFADGMIAEGGNAGVRGGIRLYLGKRDKTLIDRHRQDDPPAAIEAQGCGYGFHRGYYGQCVLNAPGPYAKPAPYHPGCWRNQWGQLRCYR